MTGQDSYEAKVRVLVVIRNNLLGDILDSLLSSAFRLQILNVLCVEPAGLVEGINLHKPDVIVVEEGLMKETHLQFPDNSLSIGRIRIITINPAANQVQVYDKYQISLTQFADFVSLIENHPR
jgi:hypothetical protein